MVYKKPQNPVPQKGLPNRQIRQIILLTAIVIVVVLIVLLIASLLKKDDPVLSFDFNGHEIPIITDLPRNPYDENLFVVNNGIMTYRSDAVRTFMGIDVSTHQETIDWDAVKSAGVDFAIIRAGRRGATEGGLYLDDTFVYNIENATRVGIDVGVYFFSQAVTVEEAQEEALLLLDWIDGYEITYPVVFDWEFLHDIEGNRTGEMTKDAITQCALAFCSLVEQAGYTPMIYFDLNMAYNYYDLSRIGHIDFWVAEWHYLPPSFQYDFQIFQYTSRGEIAGITGEVDLNISFVDYAGAKE